MSVDDSRGPTEAEPREEVEQISKVWKVWIRNVEQAEFAPNHQREQPRRRGYEKNGDSLKKQAGL